MSQQRVVRALVTAYQHPSGATCIAHRGDVIEVADEYLAEFDRIDGQPPPESPRRRRVAP